MPTPLKTIRSHSGHARFLGTELENDNGVPRVVRWIANPKEIPSPYHYSNKWPVYRWKGKDVIVRETSHRCYQAFDATNYPTVEPDND